jgi:hypothetical protein
MQAPHIESHQGRARGSLQGLHRPRSYQLAALQGKRRARFTSSTRGSGADIGCRLSTHPTSGQVGIGSDEADGLDDPAWRRQLREPHVDHVLPIRRLPRKTRPRTSSNRIRGRTRGLSVENPEAISGVCGIQRGPARAEKATTCSLRLRRNHLSWRREWDSNGR